ncbi:acyltransferase [Candidatus Pelagibacter sp.]|nr:acyltransferase [Candidatus Pelagibacter sp.]
MNINYRPEIDGLRAIAVISVIFYHASIIIFDEKLFKGGFIGVDIFFVISGYLITSIILREISTTQSFSFINFYERRVRRILPPLFFVMLLCFPVAWMHLGPTNFIDFSKSILYSIGFSSNYYFWEMGQQYAAESSLLKPFLHTWSLSVEEQYYLIFPIILFIIFRYLQNYLFLILVVSFISSLLLADWGSKYYPSATFYFLHSRAWELIAGSLLAFFEIYHYFKKNNLITQNLLSFIGFFIILFSIIFGKAYFPHPSFYTLAPVLGVCLIILFSNKNTLIGKILSTKLFVNTGLISYSLYLWHYPIFAFARINQLDPGNILNFFILIIPIVILSILTYSFIETPSRNRKIKFRNIFSSIFFLLIIIISLNLLVINKDGFKKRMPPLLQGFNFNIPPWKLLKNDKNEICHNKKNGCIFNLSAKEKVFMIGDSHSAALMFNLKDRVVKRNYSFLTSTLDGCLYFIGFNMINTNTKKIDKKCNNSYFLELDNKLKKQQNSIIIFSGRLPLYLNNSRFDNQEGAIEKGDWPYSYHSLGQFKNIQSSFKNSINRLSKNNKIILIYPIPEVGLNVKDKILATSQKNIFLRENYNFDNFSAPKNLFTTSYKAYIHRTKSSFDLLNSITGENIHKIYPHKLFCNNQIINRCVTHSNEHIFYWDDDHTSIQGNKMINDLILNEIKKIEKSFAKLN